MHTSSFIRFSALSGVAALAVSSHAALAQESSLPVEPPAEPPTLECSMSTPRARAARFVPALQRGFGVQYWGETFTAEALATQPHGVLIVEATKIGAPYSDTGHEVFFTPEEVATINQGGARPTLGYLNVSEIESYRDYWIDSTAGDESGPRPEWYGPQTVHGEHLAAYWTQAWADVVLARVDRLMTTGFDGIFLDDVLHYYSHALDDTLKWPEGERTAGPSDAPAFTREMMRLVEIIAARARAWDCDALIVVNNGVFIGRDAAGGTASPESTELFSGYLNAIDAIMIENVSAETTHPHTIEALKEDFQNHGVPVMTLDIATQFPGVEFTELRETIAAKARALGLFPYVTADSTFNQLYPPISEFPQDPSATE